LIGFELDVGFNTNHTKRDYIRPLLS